MPQGLPGDHDRARCCLRQQLAGEPPAPARCWLAHRLFRFWYRPTHLTRWAATILVTPDATDAAFRLTTNGGVRVFVAGVEAARFEPFRRNRSESVSIRLPLKAGANEVVVFTEDLAERDTDWYFELIRLDEAPLIARLPLDVDAGEVEDIRRLASGVRPEFGLNIDRPFALLFDDGVGRDDADTRPDRQSRPRAPRRRRSPTGVASRPTSY